MRVLVLIVAFFGILILPSNHRLMSVGDDDDYLAVATSIAYGKFPYFSNEYHIGQKMPFASVGPGVLASPFVFSFSLIDRLERAPIAQKREKDNRYWTWTLFGFHFAVYFYLLLGTLVIYETLKQWGSEFGALLATLMTVLGGGGLLIYAFRRPVMSHVFEFFIVSLGVFLISLALKGRRLKFHWEFIGLCAAFIFLTRYNNALLAIGLIAVFLYIQWREDRTLALRQVGKLIVSFLIPIAVFRVLPVFANGFSTFDQGYAGALDRVVPEVDPLFYWVRIGEIFLGADMGLAYTAPVALISLGALFLYRDRLPNELLLLSTFALVNIYFAAIWKSFGSYYGYRYVVFTALPLLSIYLVTLIDHLRARFGRSALIFACVAIAYFPVMSMLVFERSGKYGFSRITNSYGIDTYTQPNFHKDLLIDLLQNPFQPIVRAIQTGWSPIFSGAIPHEHLLQRLLLYFLPPILFLLFYEPVRHRIQKTAGVCR
jgi:hypothetical protein